MSISCSKKGQFLFAFQLNMVCGAMDALHTMNICLQSQPVQPRHSSWRTCEARHYTWGAVRHPPWVGYHRGWRQREQSSFDSVPHPTVPQHCQTTMGKGERGGNDSGIIFFRERKKKKSTRLASLPEFPWAGDRNQLPSSPRVRKYSDIDMHPHICVIQREWAKGSHERPTLTTMQTQTTHPHMDTHKTNKVTSSPLQTWRELLGLHPPRQAFQDLREWRRGSLSTAPPACWFVALWFAVPAVDLHQRASRGLHIYI